VVELVDRDGADRAFDRSQSVHCEAMQESRGLNDHERGGLGKHGGKVINHFADDFEEFASCIVAVDRWECDHIMAEAELIAIAGGAMAVRVEDAQDSLGMLTRLNYVCEWR
jgi:hypothetical protein